MRTHKRPDWAHWRSDPATPDWTIGVEEEVMLLDAATWSLAPVIDELLPSLSRELAASAAAETNAATVELATGVHTRVDDAIAELGSLRERLWLELTTVGLRAATAGTHPMSEWEDSRVSAGARYQLLEASLRDLTRREPTFALHLHVGIPEPELALQVLNRMRVHLPLLLALSANSPFLRGRETGFASTRTPLFQAFPRVGLPRLYDCYDEWVHSIAPMIDAGAVPESTFFWWDARLQPRLGTIEIRVMDVQTSLHETAALVALARSLVMAEATDRVAAERLVRAPEVLEENRFLAARDGMAAEFVDPRTRNRVPARVLAEEMLECMRLYATRLGCLDELLALRQLIENPPAERQRMLAEDHGVAAIVPALSQAFCARHGADATDSETALAH
ncbi:MAG TPA: YbdK family carboxylate-amine ligase [Thermoleophilaceae bacterium]